MVSYLKWYIFVQHTNRMQFHFSFVPRTQLILLMAERKLFVLELFLHYLDGIERNKISTVQSRVEYRKRQVAVTCEYNLFCNNYSYIPQLNKYLCGDHDDFILY